MSVVDLTVPIAEIDMGRTPWRHTLHNPARCGNLYNHYIAIFGKRNDIVSEESTAPFILIVDDEPDIRELIQDILNDEGYRCLTAADGNQAREVMAQSQPDLVLLDIWMPDIDGISLLKEFKSTHANMPVIMISGHGNIETAIEATKLGAADFIEKPLATAKLLHTIKNILATSESQADAVVLSPLIGSSEAVNLLRGQAQRVVQHELPILLRGEVGTDKHQLAHYLHGIGPQSHGDFVEIVASTFPMDIDKLADLGENNCLFISNLTILSAAAQQHLLFSLEHDRFKNTQLICAADETLAAAINHGDFSEALYYQLNSIALIVPPLREHREDIPALIEHFIDKFTATLKLPYRHLSVAAVNRLRNYHWSGNVQALENIIKGLLVLGGDPTIDLDELNATLATMPESEQGFDQDYIDYALPMREARTQFERHYFRHKLEETNGNVSKAAQLANIERTHLYRKLKTLGISPGNS